MFSLTVSTTASKRGFIGSPLPLKLNPSLSVGSCWFTQLAYGLPVMVTVGMSLSINTANRNELESPVTIREMREFAPRLEQVL
jgi:hypothetical protein